METTTADLSLSYTTSDYVSFGEGIKYNCSRVSGELMIIVDVYIGISLCGLVGNGVVIWFLVFHMKQNPFTIYILNLAVADFSLLLLFFLLLLGVYCLTAFCLYIFLPFYQGFVFVVEFLCQFFELSNLGLLTAITVEHCISVLFSSWYRCHRPKHLSGIVCGVLWGLAGLSVSSNYLSFIFAESYQSVFTSVDFVISMVFSSMILISDLYLCMRCGSRSRHTGKLYVAVLLDVIFFLALGISFSVEVFLNLPSLNEFFPESSSFLLVSLNSSINPVIYFLVGSCQQRQFQCSVKVAFRRLFEEKAMSEERSQVPGETAVETSV